MIHWLEFGVRAMSDIVNIFHGLDLDSLSQVKKNILKTGLEHCGLESIVRPRILSLYFSSASIRGLWS